MPAANHRVIIFILLTLAALTAPLRAESYLSYVAGNVRTPRTAYDAQGYLYIAATASSAGFSGNPIPNCPNPPCRDEIPTRYHDIVLMKVDPATGEILYRTYLSASRDEEVAALAVSPGGIVYFGGVTNSPDFHVTADALYPQRTGEEYAAFLARARPDGYIDYVTYFETPPRSFIADMAVNSAGELVVLGGQVLTKLNAKADKILVRRENLAPGGILAIGPEDSIYVAGSTSEVNRPAATPGAFQTSFDLAFCGTGFLGFPCSRQFVIKLDAGATRVIYATFVTGEREEIVSGLAVDREGNAYLTGTTSSRVYPTTPGVFQRENRSVIPLGFKGAVRAYNAYVTKVAADGSSLVYSTYLGGMGADGGVDITVDGQGVATVVGKTTSRDFPESPAVHPRCAPNDVDMSKQVAQQPYPFAIQQSFITRISADGSAVLDTRLVRGVTSQPTAVAATEDGDFVMTGVTDHPDLALTPNVRSAHPDPKRTQSGLYLARVDFRQAQSDREIDCVRDAASLNWVDGASKGQLLTLFGTDFGVEGEHIGNAGDDGREPTTLGGTRVLFDDVPGFLLYTSPEQINVQTPLSAFEPADGAPKPSVRMDVEVNSDIVASRELNAEERSPSVFVRYDRYVVNCAYPETFYYGIYPLAVARNEDGTVNSCENPAKPGSLIGMFLNGVGADRSGLEDGSIHNEPLAPLDVPVKVTVGVTQAAQVEFAGGADGQISGVWRVDARLPDDAYGSVFLSVEAGGVRAQPQEFTVWVRP